MAAFSHYVLLKKINFFIARHCLMVSTTPNVSADFSCRCLNFFRFLNVFSVHLSFGFNDFTFIFNSFWSSGSFLETFRGFVH